MQAQGSSGVRSGTGTGYHRSSGSLPAPVRAQVVNSETAVCWEGVYGTGEIIKNTQARFKAKASN